MHRSQIADLILARLDAESTQLAAEFALPGRIPSCQLERLLPVPLAESIHAAFPASEQMILKRSIKENKHIAAQMDHYVPLLEEAVYAFQDPRIIAAIGRITRLTDQHAWHSVNEVCCDGRRCCVSNYYFSHRAPGGNSYSHATSFRAEHGRGLADATMRADNAVRSAILRSIGGNLWRNPHVYQRKTE